MNPAIKTALVLIVFIIAGTALSYSLMNTSNTTGFYTVGPIDGYDLNSPENRVVLPEILFEISGLTDIDLQTVACVQDEEGLVFIYDLEHNKIIKQFKFSGDGDYEGITRVGDALFILRSDGLLFEVDNYEGEELQVTEYDTGIPVKNNEGLGYDPAHNRLLIAGKSKPKGKGNENQRTVFGFDLDTKTISEKPVYEFDLEKIHQFILDNDPDQVEKFKDSSVKINPSAIAVHPQSGELFVLSSKDHLLFIFSANGDIQTVHHLDEELFNQAEGITFLENGDMIISNEGKKDEPTLLRFKYKV